MGNSKFNVSDATTLFFPDLLSAQNMVRIIGGKIVYWKWSEGKQKLLWVSGGLSRVRVAEGKNYSERMKEIKGKSILVRVSGMRLYSEHDEYQFQIFSLFLFVEGLERKKIMKTPPSLHFWAFPVSTFIKHFQSFVFQLSLDQSRCSSNSHNCHVNAICHGTVESNTCICKPGYMGHGRTCSPNGKKLTQSQVLQNTRC